jgi:hypothetical protein
MRILLLPVTVSAGQLLAPAFACGLNLYLTVALVGITSRFGWTDVVPLGLRGLEHPLIIASALTLYLVEFVFDKIRYVDSAWDAVHTLVRPPAAALLAFLALQSSALTWQLAGGVVAGAAALSTHGLKAGLRMRLNAGTQRAGALLTSVIEDVLAAALVLSALLRPDVAVILTLAVLTIALLLGPRLIRSATVGLRLLNARVRSIFSGRRSYHRDDLPPSLRALVPDPGFGGAAPRAARAALLRGGNSGARYRTGWIVVDESSAAFVYRRLFAGRRLELQRPCTATVRHGLLADALELDAGVMILLLLKDGPDPRLTAAELARSPL